MSVEERAQHAGRGTVAAFERSTDVMTGFDQLVGRRQSQRRSRVVAVAVAAVAVVFAVLAVQSVLSVDPTPEPMDGQVPQGPFDWVSVQGTTMEIRDASGKLRWTRDLQSLGIPVADLRYPYLSNAGWLSASTDGGMWLVDLTDPAPEPRFIKGTWDSRAWSPNGKVLAALYGAPDGRQFHPSLVDPRTGMLTPLAGWFTGGGPNPAWTADSSGVLSVRREKLVVTPVDGGPDEQTIPDLWLRGDRTIGAGGRSLSWSRWTVRVAERDDARSVWYDRDLPDPIVGGNFTTNAQAALLLLQNPSDTSRVTVVRVDGTSAPEVIAHPRVDGEASWFVLAPDDSLAQITIGNRSWLLPLTGDDTTVVRTPGFLGWVTDDLIDDLATTSN